MCGPRSFYRSHQFFQNHLSAVAPWSKKIFIYSNCHIYFNCLKFPGLVKYRCNDDFPRPNVYTVRQNREIGNREIITIVINLSLLLICIVMQYQLICVIAGLLYVFSGDFQRDQRGVVFGRDLFGQLIHDFCLKLPKAHHNILFLF